jgi:hypothetical protein
MSRPDLWRQIMATTLAPPIVGYDEVAAIFASFVSSTG